MHFGPALRRIPVDIIVFHTLTFPRPSGAKNFEPFTGEAARAARLHTNRVPRPPGCISRPIALHNRLDALVPEIRETGRAERYSPGRFHHVNT